MTENGKRQSTSRREYIAGVGATVTAGLTGYTRAGGQQSYKIGFSIKNMNNPWLQVFRRTGELYAQELGHEVMATQAGGSASRQIQNVNSMLNSGIDALLISPYSSNAAVGVVEKASQQGVPVYAANSSAPTEAINLFTGFGSFDAGYRAGQIIIDAVKQRGGSRLLNLVGDQADQSAVRRSQGFLQAVEETDGIEVVQTIYNKGWSQQRATTQMSAFLQKTKDIDGVYSVWGGGALAAVNVFRKEGMLQTVDSDEYIPIVNIDGFPNVLDNIREGYILATLQQPMPFYAPISMEYMFNHLESGEYQGPTAESKVMAAGSETAATTTTGGSGTASTQSLEIQDMEVNGVRPFAEPYWSPATVTDWELEGTVYHPWLKPKTVKITRDNVDAGYLWGNYAENIL